MNKKNILIGCLACLLTGCSTQFNRVLKSDDRAYKYEYAKECFAMGKYSNCATLLQELVTAQKGRTNAQEGLYLLGMAEYGNRDYESASATFRKYCSSYPKGDFAEQASFYIGKSLYESTPEPRLDQSPTIAAINAYQNFLDNYPDSPRRDEAQQALFKLQDNLVQKEYLSAKNYESCIITAQNALKAYPYSDLREKFSILIMKSKFQLAENSSEEKRIERYRDAEDECYGFLNEFPDSKESATAQKYIVKCKKITGD